MLLTRAMYNSIVTRMLSDTNFLAKEDSAASAVALILIKAPFAANRELALGDLTLIDADDFDPPLLGCGDVTQVEIADTLGNRGIKLVEPIGGFTWNSVLNNGPVTIYGVAMVLTSAGAPTSLIGVGTFAAQYFALPNLPLQVSSVIGLFVGATFDPSTGIISGGTTPPLE